MTACLLYAKIHKNKAENLLHLMLYFSMAAFIWKKYCIQLKTVVYTLYESCF